MVPEITISPLDPKDLGAIHRSFQEAFSDYLVRFNMSRPDFEKKFVEKLQMEFDGSAGAWDNGSLVGFIFTGIDNYQGSKVAYNGGTGVVPRCRGQGFPDRLFPGKNHRL